MDRNPPITPPDRAAPAGEMDSAAAMWVARKNDGLNAEERRQLHAWLAADPRHAAAFARADTGRTELDWPLHSGTVDDVLAGLENRATKRRRRRRTILATGALAALAVAAGLSWRASVRHHSAPTSFRSPTLVVKEPQRQMLPDGSIVELKDGAQITANFTGAARLVILSQGTAHFQVITHPRPFIVNAAGITARALGTMFSVEFDGQNVSVLVTEGRVAVNKESEAAKPKSPLAPPAAGKPWSPLAPPAAGKPASSDATAQPGEPLAILEAGKSVIVPIAPDALPVAPVVATLPAGEMEDRLAWRIPRLEFNGTPLSEVVAMVNRYNREQFVVADPVLERLTLSGVLRADKVDALVVMLESDFPVKADRRDGKIILRQSR